MSFSYICQKCVLYLFSWNGFISFSFLGDGKSFFFFLFSLLKSLENIFLDYVIDMGCFYFAKKMASLAAFLIGLL